MTFRGHCGEILPGQRNIDTRVQTPVIGNGIPGGNSTVVVISTIPQDVSSPFPYINYQTGWKCIEEVIYCDPPFQTYIKSYTRRCVQCTFDDPDCVQQTREECEANCLQYSQSVGCPNEISLPQNQISTDPKNVVISQVQQQTNVATQTSQANVLVNAQSQYLKNTIGVLNNLYLNSNIYHPKYNFFKVDEQQQNTNAVLVRNYLYPSILANQVTEEVSHILNATIYNTPWSEIIVQQLTLQKVEISLNPEFLRTLKSIRNIHGETVDKNRFLEAIRRHLLTGTMNEVDVGYFNSVAASQLNSDNKTYALPSNEQQRQKIGLTKLILESIVPVAERSSEFQGRNIRRQRRLNEDINTKTCACTLNGDTKEFLIPNAGICVTTLGGGSFNIENSPGDGYYLYLNTVDQGCIPYVYDTDVSASLLATPRVRYEAMRMAGIDPSLYITGRSNDSNHEFISGLDSALEFEPLYMKLDLSSVSSIPTNNLIVDKVSATFSRLTDQDLIDEHTDNNGLAVTRVFIDYKDPIYKYIKDSGTLSIVQNDINLKNLSIGRYGNELLLTRNLPFGIVIIPCRGSRFNPFNGTSKIDSFTDTVSRTIEIVPSIDIIDSDYSHSPLEINLLYNLGTDRVGIAEPKDKEAITYRFNPSADYNLNTILVGTTYTSSIDPISSYGLSYMVKDVIDYIIDTYNPEEITWYDIFRRMPLSRFGELMYDAKPEVLLKIAEGYRGNIKIKPVLDRPGASDKILPDDEKVIIRLIDRN